MWWVIIKNKISQAVSRLSSKWIVCKMTILGQFGIENYALKIRKIQKIFLNIAYFPCVIFKPKLSQNLAWKIGIT